MRRRRAALALAIVLCSTTGIGACPAGIGSGSSTEPGSAFAQHWLAHWYETRAARRRHPANAKRSDSRSALRRNAARCRESISWPPPILRPHCPSRRKPRVFSRRSAVQSSLIALYSMPANGIRRAVVRAVGPVLAIGSLSAILGEPGDAQSLLIRPTFSATNSHPRCRLGSVGCGRRRLGRVCSTG